MNKLQGFRVQYKQDHGYSFQEKRCTVYDLRLTPARGYP